ncbi:hypothetical protein EDB87DRAFT_1607206, partial [Lactarius vividus]
MHTMGCRLFLYLQQIFSMGHQKGMMFGVLRPLLLSHPIPEISPFIFPVLAATPVITGLCKILFSFLSRLISTPNVPS